MSCSSGRDWFANLKDAAPRAFGIPTWWQVPMVVAAISAAPKPDAKCITPDVGDMQMSAPVSLLCAVSDARMDAVEKVKRNNWLS